MQEGAGYDEGDCGAHDVGAGDDEPAFHAVDEASDGHASAVADHGWKGDEDSGKP